MTIIACNSFTMQEVLGRLRDPKPDGHGGYMTFCPCHNDGAKHKKRSLAVTEKDGRVLLKCFAGCATEDIVRQIGLTMADLFTKQSKSFKEIAETYDYHTATGKLLFQTVKYQPKDYRQRRPNGAGGWVWNLKSVTPVPYDLPELLKAIENKDTVFIAEGEKDCDRLAGLGLVATTNHGGAGKWRDCHSNYFPPGTRVVVIPDCDEPGQRHAEAVAAALTKRKCKVKILRLPGLPDKGDVSDWLDTGGTVDQLLTSVEAVEIHARTLDEQSENEKKKTAELLINIACSQTLFHAPDKAAFTTINRGDYEETLPIRSKEYRMWLKERFYRTYEKAPNSQAFQDAIGIIEAKAVFDGHEIMVFVRVAAVEGKIYIDLARKGQAIEITDEIWRVIKNAPVKFWWPAGMLPLPDPKTGGDIKRLKSVLNVSDDDWPLIFGWLIGSLHPTGPYPVLSLISAQGDGKSTLSRFMRSVIDPHCVSLRSLPREERDLAISAQRTWVLAYDNLSRIPDWLSDAFCRLSTGGGFGARELYSDDREVIFDSKRPLILNGINDLNTRQDLADRSIAISLPAIKDDNRDTEKDLQCRFNEIHPDVLGGLCEALVAALQNRDSVELKTKPRMLDFTVWVVAAESKLPWDAGEFLTAYLDNRMGQVQISLESDVIAQQIIQLIEKDGDWTGTAAGLLSVIRQNIPEEARNKTFPATPRSLSGRIRRAESFLRQIGIEISFERISGGKRTRQIHIRRVSKFTSLSSPSSQDTREASNGAVSARDGSGTVNEFRDGSGTVRDDSGTVRDVNAKPANADGCKVWDGRDGRDGKLQTPQVSNEWDELCTVSEGSDSLELDDSDKIPF